MTHDIPHDLEPELARKVLRKAVDAYVEQFKEYDFDSRWVGDGRVELVFRVAGKTMDGHMEVQPKALHLELDVPFVFRPFKGKAVQIIEDEVKDWIQKAREGALD